MAKEKTEIEIIVCDFNARTMADIARRFKTQCKKLFDHEDLSKLDTGLSLSQDYLTIGGHQPSLAELTVLANKLQIQISLRHVELNTIENVESKKRAAAK
jgi:hypothetical protein